MTLSIKILSIIIRIRRKCDTQLNDTQHNDA
jgi:hypothetical protein